METAAKEQPDSSAMESALHRMGGSGRYNILVLAAMMLCIIFPGMITLSANFTAADMPFNCSRYDNGTGGKLISDLTECSVEPNHEEDSRCSISYNCTSSPFVSIAGDSSSHIFTTRCLDFQFSSGTFQETSVSKFGLVCSRSWQASLATTFYFVGFLVGCSLYGALADRFGRLRMILVALLHSCMCTVAVSQAPILWLYWTLQLLAGVGIGGLRSCLVTFNMENADPEHRTVWAFSLNNGWTLGIFIGTLIAYFERNYQRLLLFYGVSVVAALPALLLLSESPRWLLSVGQHQRADDVLRRIARINGRQLEETFSSKLMSKQSSANGSLATRALQLMQLPGMRRVSFIVWTTFLISTMGYFGIWFGIGDLGGSVFVNQLIAAAVEIPSRLFGMFVSHRIGRRITFMLAFGLGGCCLMVTAFMAGNGQLMVPRIAAAVIGKFWLTLALDMSWLYSGEVFPTAVRSLGVGIGSTVSRVGAMISTLVPLLGLTWRPLPFLLLAVSSILGMLLTCAAPETKGQKLPETLDDGERLAMETLWKRSKKFGAASFEETVPL